MRFNAAGRRDPFLNPILLRRKADELNQEVTPQYVPPGIAGTYIAQAKLLGILSKGGIPTAVFQANDQRAYFMKESEKLLDGYIKKIDSDSVLLVRETHLRSGKTITQDVVKRLRTP